MDKLMNSLIALSKRYRRLKVDFYSISNELINSFNLSQEQKSSVAFGITKTSYPDLQIYVDILNSNMKLTQLSKRLIETKCVGIIKILEFALKCNEQIQGYNLGKLLDDPKTNREEIIDLFDGLTGVHNIHLIDDKIMMEMPARECILSNPKLLKYIDFWCRILNK
jgi:hypothetical protein